MATYKATPKDLGALAKAVVDYYVNHLPPELQRKRARVEIFKHELAEKILERAEHDRLLLHTERSPTGTLAEVFAEAKLEGWSSVAAPSYQTLEIHYKKNTVSITETDGMRDTVHLYFKQGKLVPQNPPPPKKIDPREREREGSSLRIHTLVFPGQRPRGI